MDLPAQLAPTVKPNGAPGTFRRVEVSGDTFGEQVGRAAQGLGVSGQNAGDIGAQVAIDFQKQANEAAVEQANSDYDAKRRNALFGENGFYTKKGLDAWNSRGPTSASIEEMRAQTRAGLKNPEQQRMFDVISQRNTENDLRSMSAHSTSEFQVYRVGVVDSSIGNAVANAQAYWNDPVRFAQELGTVKMFAENRAQLLGRTDPEMIKRDIDHYEAQAWDARIKAAIIHNPKLADAMFQANKDQIRDVGIRANLEHVISVSVMPQDAREDAEKAMTEAVPGQVEVGGQPSAPAPAGKATKAGFDAMLAAAGESGKVSSATQLDRDQKRLALLQKELASPNTDANDRKALSQEIATTQASIAKLQTQTGGDGASAAPGGGATPAGFVNPPNAPQMARDTRAMLTNWLPAAERLAEQRHPGNAVYRDLVITQVKNRVNTIAAAQEAVERQAIDTVKGAILTSGATDLAQLYTNPAVVQALPRIPIAAYQGLLALTEHNARSARGENIRSDPAVVNELFKRINAEENSPDKIRSVQELAPYFAHGLNRTDYDWLGKKIEEARNPEGSPFLRDVNQAKSRFRSMMRSGPLGEVNVMTGDADRAEYAFNKWLDGQIDKFRAEKKDPRLLLKPGSPDFALSPENVASFTKSAKELVNAGANAVRAGAPAAAAPVKITGDADYEKLAKGTRYVGPDGVVRVK